MTSPQPWQKPREYQPLAQVLEAIHEALAFLFNNQKLFCEVPGRLKPLQVDLALTERFVDFIEASIRTNVAESGDRLLAVSRSTLLHKQNKLATSIRDSVTRVLSRRPSITANGIGSAPEQESVAASPMEQSDDATPLAAGRKEAAPKALPASTVDISSAHTEESSPTSSLTAPVIYELLCALTEFGDKGAEGWRTSEVVANAKSIVGILMSDRVPIVASRKQLEFFDPASRLRRPSRVH
jgi:hypothetical protein